MNLDERLRAGAKLLVTYSDGIWTATIGPPPGYRGFSSTLQRAIDRLRKRLEDK